MGLKYVKAKSHRAEFRTMRVLLIRGGSWHKAGDDLKRMIEAGQLTENQISGNLAFYENNP